MKQRPGIYYTEEQKSLIWDRWQRKIKKHSANYHKTITKVSRINNIVLYPSNPPNQVLLTLSSIA